MHHKLASQPGVNTHIYLYDGCKLAIGMAILKFLLVVTFSLQAATSADGELAICVQLVVPTENNAIKLPVSKISGFTLEPFLCA